MKIATREHRDDFAGVQDEVKISFEANAIAFYAQISGLAKDKISYPIRELSTNARDATVDRYGADVPEGRSFEVTLPTALNPVFKVRDYGFGMSPEQMVNVYARLYASTKRSDNAQAGGWGLGSKSPFAYLIGDEGAGAYTVTSYHGGFMRTYIMSLDASGTPVMRKLAELPSNAETGMEVSFPVRRADISDFQDKARYVLWSFDPRPTVTPDPKWSKDKVQARGEGWTHYQRGSTVFSGPHVRMGGVMYPFDLSEAGGAQFLTDSDDVLFDAPIGSLKVTLSREALAYDETTRATLRAAVSNYERQFRENIQAKVNEAETFFEAAAVFNTETRAIGSYRMERLRDVMTWNGVRLRTTLEKSENAKYMRLAAGWSTFERFDGGGVIQTANCVGAKVVVEHRPWLSAARFRAANLVGQSILWVRCSREDREAVLTMLGNPEEVYTLDDAEVEVVRQQRPKTVRKRRVISMMDSGAYEIAMEDVDLADPGLYIQITGRGRYNSNVLVRQGRLMQQYQLSDLFGHLIAIGALPVTTKILIPQENDNLEGWTMLGDEVDARVREVAATKVWDPMHNKSWNSIENRLRMYTEHNYPLERAPADLVAVITRARELRGQLSNVNRSTTLADRAITAMRILGLDAPEAPNLRTQCPFDVVNNQWNMVLNRYQLLGVLIHFDRYGYGGSHEHRTARQRVTHYFELLAAANQIQFAEAAE